MINIFKKMTPEEAAKFRVAGAKFMIIPFSIILIIAMAIVFSTIQKSSNKQKLADTLQNNAVTQNVCFGDLKECGSGCIPGNAFCCDETNGNSYCLWPDTQCKANPATNGEKERFICSNDEKVKSYDCPVGQIFCGMFCIDAGKRCCIGGVCDENPVNVNSKNNNDTEQKITVNKNSLQLAGPVCKKEPCLVSTTVVVSAKTSWHVEKMSILGASDCFDPIKEFSRLWSVCPGSGGPGDTTVTVSTMIAGESTPSDFEELLIRRQDKINFISDDFIVDKMMNDKTYYSRHYAPLEISMTLPYWR